MYIYFQTIYFCIFYGFCLSVRGDVCLYDLWALSKCVYTECQIHTHVSHKIIRNKIIKLCKNIFVLCLYVQNECCAFSIHNIVHTLLVLVLHV